MKGVWRSLKDSYRHQAVKAAKSGSNADNVMDSWEYSTIMNFYHAYQHKVDERETLQGGLTTHLNEMPASPASADLSDFSLAPSPSPSASSSRPSTSNYANSIVSSRLKRKAKSDIDEDDEEEAQLKNILGIASKLLTEKPAPAAPTLKYSSYWESLDKMWEQLPVTATTSLFCQFIGLTNEAIISEQEKNK